MHLATRNPRLRAAVVAAFLAAVVFAAGLSRPAAAYVDVDGDKLDDRIETVHAAGWNAAFLNNDPSQRMRIGVANPAGPIVYAIYVAYDHHPTLADQSALLAIGAGMSWPFENIDYIESRATFPQIVAIAALPGVTAVEAVPVEYAVNHYGSRVVRARDSRGLSAAENEVLFPNARTHLGLDGTGIVIAILDTGVNDEADALPVYPGNEGLQGKFLGGGEFWCGQPECSTPANGSANPQDHGAEASSYHGTHVAGTAMGTGGPGGYFAGVAPGARLVDCKVLSDAGASVGGSTRGLDWCISNRNRLWPGLLPGSIWQGIDVVNMSLGSTECATGTGTSNGTGASNAAVNAAVDAGIVVVVATGNDSAIDCVASPSAADKSIAVGASTHARTLDRSDDQVTTFSNEGVRDDDGDADHFDEYKPSVVAPGAGIISASGDVTTDGSAYSQLSGTSMAAPHVAGCAALVLQANPTLAPLQVRSIFQNTADHNLPTAKATGDRGQDPYGIDPNYDLSSGYGLIDVYAAAKEALNSTSGVQVVQIRAVPRPDLGRIDFRWITQREFPFLGFDVWRASDANGVPGTFVKLNTLPVPPAGDPVLQGDDNRQLYTWADSDPGLVVGQQYWYRVDWIDLLGTAHSEPAVPVSYGTLARIATAFYSIVHNAVDNDLLVRVGGDYDYTPGGLGNADFEVLGPGESGQDSARVLLPATVPPNTGTSTAGTVEHFFSVGFRQGDDAETFLPPSMSKPWFLHVTDAGFVNRTGRVTSFSLFVNDSPGSPSGSTYVTNHMPMPQPTGEFGLTPAVLWIPEQQPTATVVARFQGEARENGVRLLLELTAADPGVRATVFRALSDDFAVRELLTPEPLALGGRTFEYLDAELRPATTYHYWVRIHEADGTSFVNGPVAVTTGGGTALSFAATPKPNPVRDATVFEYVVGADVARAGAVDVSLRIHDLQGRVVRTLHAAPQASGSYRAAWDATDQHGRRVPAGVYSLLFRAGGFRQSRQVTVAR